MANPFLGEITNTPDELAIVNSIRGELSQIWFAMPAVVAKDTTDGHIAQLQPAIKGTVIDKDGKKTFVAYPLVDDVPVHHHGGGKNVHTMPVVKGDEYLLAFASRMIDPWHQNGGTDNNPIDARMHHMSDAFTIRAYRSDPRKIKNVSNVSAQNRSEDGKHTHDVHPTNGITTKSVDPNDTADNPWLNAKKYFQSFVLAATGVFHQAVDGSTTHQSTVDHDEITHSLNNGQHVISVHKTNGITASWNNGQHTTTLTDSGINHKSATSISHDAPVVNVKQLLDVTGKIAATSDISSGGIMSALGGLFGGGGSGISATGAINGTSAAVTGAITGTSVAVTGSGSAATILTNGYTVAALNAAFPPASNVGLRAYVTDATAPAFLSTLAGSGAVVCPAFCDGTHWVAG
jgi:hypothetical protein